MRGCAGSRRAPSGAGTEPQARACATRVSPRPCTLQALLLALLIASAAAIAAAEDAKPAGGKPAAGGAAQQQQPVGAGADPATPKATGAKAEPKAAAAQEQPAAADDGTAPKEVITEEEVQKAVEDAVAAQLQVRWVGYVAGSWPWLGCGFGGGGVAERWAAARMAAAAVHRLAFALEALARWLLTMLPQNKIQRVKAKLVETARAAELYMGTGDVSPTGLCRARAGGGAMSLLRAVRGSVDACSPLLALQFPGHHCLAALVLDVCCPRA